MVKISPKASSSVEKFQLFASALDDSSWLDYTYKGGLNLKLIGSLCDISRSTLYANEHLKSEIIKIGTSLLDKGIIQVLPYEKDEKDEKVIKARSTHVTKNSKELEQLRSENQRLNNRINELIAQLDDKNSKLSRFETMERILGDTGRIPR